MIIIWSGWGILVPLFAFLAFVVTAVGSTPAEQQFGLAHNVAVAASFGGSGVLAGLALFFIARAIEAKKARVLVDPATNQQFRFRKTAGSFFFIPTRYWAFITPLLGLGMAAAAMTSKTPF